MRRIKFLLIFLAVLLVIIVLKSVWIGLMVFSYLVKYLAIAGVIAWVVFLIAKNAKKSE
jgi:hypothetical protein